MGGSLCAERGRRGSGGIDRKTDSGRGPVPVLGERTAEPDVSGIDIGHRLQPGVACATTCKRFPHSGRSPAGEQSGASAGRLKRRPRGDNVGLESESG